MHELFKKRRSIRKYTSQKVTDRQIKEILSAAMVAPSARNRRPWQFWVVKDKEVLEKLSGVHRWADFIAQASACLIVGSVPDQRWVENCAIVAAHIYLEVANQGLGTCFIQIREATTESGEDCEEYVRKILKIDPEIRILCLMPIGYPDEKVAPHSEAEYDKNKVH